MNNLIFEDFSLLPEKGKNRVHVPFLSSLPRIITKEHDSTGVVDVKPKSRTNRNTLPEHVTDLVREITLSYPVPLKNRKKNQRK